MVLQFRLQSSKQFLAQSNFTLLIGFESIPHLLSQDILQEL